MNTRTPITDEWIQQAVLTELKWEEGIEPNEIGVRVEDGVVTLTGFVDCYAKRLAAEDAAQRVHGVRAVANDVDIRLSLGNECSDSALAAAIVHALEGDGSVPTDKLEISVSHGWVTLKGELSRPYQLLHAERVVRHLVGVTGLTNLITVQPPVAHPELSQQIEDAIVRNARTDATQINVDMHDGKVVLTGTVRSWAEHHDAERAVWLAPGVEAVVNRLVVEIPSPEGREGRDAETMQREMHGSAADRGGRRPVREHREAAAAETKEAC